MLPGLLQGSMMSSMIYTQGHIGEEMYKLPESLTVWQFEDKNLTGINVKNVNDQAVFLPFLSPIYFTVSMYCRKQILWHNNLPISSKWRQCGTIYFNRHYMDSTGHADTKAGYRRLHVICRLRGSPFGLKNGATNRAFVWVEACHKKYPQT